MKSFINEHFLLQTESAKRLYHEYAEEMPIIDYHCHLSPQEISEDRQFENLTQIWLNGDHYKWRALRAAGVEEQYITGNANDWEKFIKWAKTTPLTLRNPLFHWTMLELNRPFGIRNMFLNESTAEEIWNRCNDMLAQKSFSARGIMRQMNVRVVCTTDDPVDPLEYHKKIAADNQNGSFDIRVLPTFRPDRILPINWDFSTEVHRQGYRDYLEKLGKSADVCIHDFSSLRDAILKRHQYFHENGCRLSDHGFELFRWTQQEPESFHEKTIQKLLRGESVSDREALELSSLLLMEIGRINAEKGWVMQLHIGAMRNNSSRLFRQLGPDAGSDSMVDGAFAKSLSRFFDCLDQQKKLPRTIVYNLNPSANYLLASLIANFNDGSIPGKMQFGSGWWFLDQKKGMEDQIETLSNMGLLSLFVGMLTDSRSFLSYTRHEYFRRILCNILGSEMENGLLPNDFEWIGNMVRDISFRNAQRYFRF
ncbi:MAG: glucuronate isomerase [Planctomycetia bacterium]|nr:glucuronate isomerase [Planctomycetia bacterium]